MAAKQDSVTLAALGGPKAITDAPGDLFTWPIVTAEDEAAVLDVLRRGAMSANDVTKQFEREMAEFFGTKYALGSCNGTASLQEAMWAVGLRAGDELIGPALTYWATVLPALSLGVAVKFADVDPQTLCIDPRDVERHIGPRTRAVVVTHVCGHPCDMDPIMAVARRHGLKVIEDVSHAHGGLYKGRMLGTIGDVGAMSLMSGKSLPCGEAGMIVTNDRDLWERAIAFGFYERNGVSRFAAAAAEVTDPALTRLAGVPLGGAKHRMHQMSAAVGRVQLRHYAARIAEIQQAMNFFWDCLRGVPGLREHRVDPASRSTMGGWYFPNGHYVPDELGGLSVDTFVKAVAAEGVPMSSWFYKPLHLHPIFQDADVYGHGRPTCIAFADRDVRQVPGSLPVAEGLVGRTVCIPWFKHHRPDAIRRYADAIRKVSEHADQLSGAS
jgi:dTDP-4-amino-4,6-dideoxygalactose transaminase